MVPQKRFKSRRFPCLLLLLAASAVLGVEPPDDTPSELLRIPDVVYIPTPPDVVEAMLELANVSKDDVVFDLGCGDGRIPIAAASRFGCQAFGCDIDPLRVAAARKNVRESGVEHLVQIEQKSLFDIDLQRATVVTLYLSPEFNRRLIPQLRKLPPGSRIVSHQFNIHGLVPDKVIRVKSRHDPYIHLLYLWTAPL